MEKLSICLAHIQEDLLSHLLQKCCRLPSRLARDVFFPVLLTILERCDDPHAIFRVNAITTLLQRLIDEISRDDTFFALLVCALLSLDGTTSTQLLQRREIACAFDALCDCAFGIDKKPTRVACVGV